MNVTDYILKFLLAVGLGALMGLERDGSWKVNEDLKDLKKSTEQASQKFTFIKKNIPASSFGGVRTYILISLLGGITGLAYINGITPLTWIITSGFIFFILVSFILNYFDKNTFGLTTEISLIINFILSLLLLATDISTKLIVAIAVVDVLVLSLKNQMRGMVSKFSGREVIDTIKFVLVSAVFLPFMPNQMYGFGDIPVFGDMLQGILGSEFIEASKIFNPYQIFMIVVLMVSLNFIGYFLSKAIGKDKSLNLLGLLGGLVSSTIVTQDMAFRSKETKDNETINLYISATALTNMISFVRILAVTMIFNFAFSKIIFLPMIAMSLVLLIWAIYVNIFNRKTDKKEKKNVHKKGIEFDTPFALKPAIKFGLMYLAVVSVSQISLFYLGDSGFIVSSMIASLHGLDEITITTATLVGKEITMNLGLTVLVIAACVNLVVKVVFVSISGNVVFRTKVAKMFFFTIIGGVLALLFVVNR